MALIYQELHLTIAVSQLVGQVCITGFTALIANNISLNQKELG